MPTVSKEKKRKKSLVELILGGFNGYDYTHKRPEPDTLPPTRRPNKEEPSGTKNTSD